MRKAGGRAYCADHQDMGRGQGQDFGATGLARRGASPAASVASPAATATATASASAPSKPAPIISAASLRRRLAPGVRVTTMLAPVVDRIGVTREVLALRSKDVILAEPAARDGRSYLDLPKASELRIDGPDEFTILGEDGQPWLSYRIELDGSEQDEDYVARRAREVVRARAEAQRLSDERERIQREDETRRQAEAEQRRAAHRAEEAAKREAKAAARAAAREQGLFTWNDQYKDLAQVEPHYDAYLAVRDELVAGRGSDFAYDADFEGRIEGVAGSPDETTAIYLLQGLHRERQKEAREQALLAEGYERVERAGYAEPIDGQHDRKSERFASVATLHEGWRTFEGARLIIGSDGAIRGILPKGKRTSGIAAGPKVLVKR